MNNTMSNAILDNIIIVILCVLGVVFGKSPLTMVIVAAILMMTTTYVSLDEENKDWIHFFYIVILIAFAIISWNPSGYLIFVLDKKCKASVRVAFGCILFVFVDQLLYCKDSVAVCLLYTICLLGLFGVWALFRALFLRFLQQKILDEQRVRASNISELHEKRLNEQLIKQRYTDEKNARLLERENISRNIHNSVGHSITAAIMTLDAADILYDSKPEEARKKMNDANNRIRGSLDSIRRAVRVLDEANVDLTAGELKSELAEISNEFVMDTNIDIKQNYDSFQDDIIMPNDHVVFLTGVLQEMLTNGVKHGNADRFMVVLSGDSANVRLEIIDNGTSDFDKTNETQRIENGFGVKKIISYVEKCGGKTQFSNENGFHSVVELPIVFGG